MSVWTAPATFVAGTALPAATMNAEVRDHLNWLKGFADLVTNSTAADTGTATELRISRAAAASTGFAAQVSGDAVARFLVQADGGMTWGDGALTRDISLSRLGAGNLLYTTNGTAFNAILLISGTVGQRAGFSVQLNGDSVSRSSMFGDATRTGLEFGSGAGGRDVNIYRSAADYLTSDDKLRPASFKAQIKAGAPIDGDIVGGAESGDMVLDTTNSKIYFRVGATWKGVVIA